MSGENFGKFNAIAFDQMLVKENLFSPGHSTINLQGIKLITLSALVQLTAACFALSKVGKVPIIKIDDLGVRSYLQRINFITLINNLVIFDPPYHSVQSESNYQSQNDNPFLIEITQIKSHLEVEEVLNKLTDTFNHILFL